MYFTLTAHLDSDQMPESHMWLVVSVWDRAALNPKYLVLVFLRAS